MLVCNHIRVSIPPEEHLMGSIQKKVTK